MQHISKACVSRSVDFSCYFHLILLGTLFTLNVEFRLCDVQAPAGSSALEAEAQDRAAPTGSKQLSQAQAPAGLSAGLSVGLDTRALSPAWGLRPAPA